jgi:hypothetical protein
VIVSFKRPAVLLSLALFCNEARAYARPFHARVVTGIAALIVPVILLSVRSRLAHYIALIAIIITMLWDRASYALI